LHELPVMVFFFSLLYSSSVRSSRNLSFLYHIFPFFSHLTSIIRFLEIRTLFYEVRLLSRPTPNMEDQRLPFVWPLPSDLSSMCDPIRSFRPRYNSSPHDVPVPSTLCSNPSGSFLHPIQENTGIIP
jgi:hypothetical protein